MAINAGLVAGSANLLNLFDLRPGRAIKVALAAAARPSRAGRRPAAPPPRQGAQRALLGEDLGERAMLGDAGANALGAVLGAAAAASLPRGARLAVLAGITGLTAASEVVSFTKVIERTAPLRWLDMLGRRPSAAGPARPATGPGATRDARPRRRRGRRRRPADSAAPAVATGSGSRSGTNGEVPASAGRVGMPRSSIEHVRRGLGRAAVLISAITVLARLAGFGRTLVFARTVGATSLGTAYTTANQVPNIIFDIVAGGALTAVVVPVLAGPARRAARDPAAAADARRTASALLTWTILLLVPLSVILALVAGPVVTVLFGRPTARGRPR